MKLLRLSVAVSTVFLLFPPAHSPVNAQEQDYVCFMTTQSGKIMDLSESVCGFKKSTTSVSANNDRAFIEDYQRNVMEYPEVRDNLLANAQQSPEQSISQAKSLCNVLKAGLSFNEQTYAGEGEAKEKAGIVNAAVINTLATKYYCPEVSSQ